MFSNSVSVCVRGRKYWRACVISRSDNLRWAGSGMSAEIIPLISCAGVLQAGGPTGRSALSTPRDQDLSVVLRGGGGAQVSGAVNGHNTNRGEDKQLELHTSSLPHLSDL